MKKSKKLMGILFFSVLLIIITCKFTIASNDKDGDGIDDKLEQLNKREIDYTIEGSEISIESVRNGDHRKDLISTTIVCSEDGIQFLIGYKSNLESDFELMFSITFREIIEFIDNDENGIYNPEVDKNIQNFSLNEFSPIYYENSTDDYGSVIHYFRIQTVNETFTAHIYFSEEFSLLENTLILPTQAIINIEISNFPYLNFSSQLSLYTRLESEGNYERQEDTEDERNKYAENEQGVMTTMGDDIGFFTWKENAKIDNFPETVVSSEILPDDHIESAEKLYINYMNGTHISHSAKIGIEGLLVIPQSSSLIPIIVISLVIGALSVISVYSIIHTNKQDLPTKDYKRPGEEDYTEILEADLYDSLFDSTLALQIFEEKGAIEKLYHKGDINITTISSDFFEKVNNLGLEKGDQQNFIREMLSIPPKERELFLKEMIIEIQ
ncbi:MAG: hypothetical protein ACFFA3_15685 [Promethearchaeota archaeon]